MNVSVNGVEVAAQATTTNEFAAARELLRQRAVMIGLVENAMTDETQIDQAIEELISREIATPEPTEDECRRYYEAHPDEFENGDLVHVRHILFQVTPRVSLPAIRARAESALHSLLAAPDRFAAMAAEMSNCPSGRNCGNLGQIGRGETVPEFETVLFRLGPTSLLPELVKTRYGFHIVAIDQRIAGSKLPFETAREKIAEHLVDVVTEKALQQYISLLAGQATVEGVDLSASTSPLVQ